MKHLFLCREYSPTAYPPGGIGTYVRHMTSLLARAGETVHVIAHRWDGAPDARQESVGGRLIVHRVALDEPILDKWAISQALGDQQVPRGLLASSFPSQAFSWQAALLAERLIESEGVEVIEAQEWEAPLYYFQLRRALNLGPARRPPCVVHLHSPSEQIFAANGWDTTVADYLPAVALEEYSITAADAILCPSRFLAEQALVRYRIDRSRVSVIPYPLGDAPHLDRSAHTWATGSICHVGRIELRKGVLEWADAVASIAVGHPDLDIEFVGGDTPLDATGGSTVGDAVRARVPHRVRRQFRFHGSRARSGVIGVLSRACAAVVPSRWENFPYSCIESMCSGLPVIASPNGGMRDLVADGISGWIAADSTPAGLAGALRRALDTPAAERARMGAAAEETVRRVCANETILRRHLELKTRLACAPRSGHVPSPAAAPRPLGGMGLIVSCPADGPRLDSCFAGIRAQTDPPAAVCLVCDGPRPDGAAFGAPEDWRIMQREGRSVDEAEIAAARLMASSDPSLAGLAFADSRVHLASEFLAVCRTVFAQDARLGIVSAWTHETDPRDRVHIQPTPSVPYIWHDEEVAPFIAVRKTAFEEAVAGDRPPAGARRKLFDGIMRSGWTALTYPAVLGSIVLDRQDPAARPSVARYSSMAQALQRLHMPLLRWLFTCPAGDRRAFVRQGLRNPARSARWLAGRALPGWRARLQESL